MHRDIKGANILLTDNGDVKLADFGVSAQITATINKRRSFIGTPYWMAPEVAAVERKGGYNQLCDIWATGITAIELAELQPPMFDLHPMRALFLMSKSGFKPPTLKEKDKWSQTFHSFVKISLTKNPKKRPNAERLLQHQFVNGGGAGTGEMSVRLMRELLHKYQNPHQFVDGCEMDEEGAIALSSVPQRIPSKMGTIQRAHLLGESSSKSSNNNNIINETPLSPPDTLPSEMSLSSYMDAQWDRMTLSSSGNNCAHQRGCKVDESLPSTSAASSSSVVDDSPKRHNSMDRLVGMFSDLGSAASRQRSLSDGEQQQPDILNNTPPVPPKRNKHRRQTSPPPLHHPMTNGLPPTPKVLMGACFSKVFNGCPLHINCTASWINPETRDQHIIIGADEGIFNLNMNEIHDAVIDQLYLRRTVWLYVIKDVLMSLSGESYNEVIILIMTSTDDFTLCSRKILSIVSS